MRTLYDHFPSYEGPIFSPTFVNWTLFIHIVVMPPRHHALFYNLTILSSLHHLYLLFPTPPAASFHPHIHSLPLSILSPFPSLAFIQCPPLLSRSPVPTDVPSPPSPGKLLRPFQGRHYYVYDYRRLSLSVIMIAYRISRTNAVICIYVLIHADLE